MQDGQFRQVVIPGMRRSGFHNLSVRPASGQVFTFRGGQLISQDAGAHRPVFLHEP
jgi:hypothetical protein